jgi:hypothetical protein
MANEIVEPKADTIEDIIDILDSSDDADDNDQGDQDDEESGKEAKAGRDTGKQESKEDAEDKEQTDEEEIELAEPEDELEFVNVPRKKEILKEFPELFKKFPGMERALYKEAQYAELFPTMQEAKIAKEELRGLKEVEAEILNGDLENVLKSVKEQNPESFDKVVNNYIHTLRKVDEQAYYGVLNFIIDNAIVTAYKTGHEQQDEQLMIAAQLINKFVHGSHNIQHPRYPRQVRPENDPREQQLAQKQTELNYREFNGALSDVTERTENTIKATIDKYIDSKSQMTPYLRDKAVTDVLAELNQSIQSDARFKSVLDNLWRESANNGYSTQSKNKIRNQIINKAKVVLPDIIRRVRAEALKNNRSMSIRNDKDDERASDREEREPSERRTQTNKKPQMPSRKVSTLDFLNQD